MKKLHLTGTVDKVAGALAILRSCYGESGIWASPDRYRYTCWTRDLAYAIAPLLHEMGEHDLVLNHLRSLSQLQRPNGQVPMVFLDDEESWLHDKEHQEKKRGREPFMLKRYREGELWNLTPGTRDSEICYLLAVYEYVRATGDMEFLRVYGKNIADAHRYIETNLMRDGLVVGCDWRDTMHEELGDKALLTNNALMMRVYRLMNHGLRAGDLLESLDAVSLISSGDEGLRDYRGSDRVDPLGLSFLRLIADKRLSMQRSFERACRSVDSPNGVTIKCRHKPGAYSGGDEAAVIEETDGVVVWPFVVGYTVLAALKLAPDEQTYEFAREQFVKLHALEGFWEWYDPRTGKGYGAPAQLWSAALYLRAFFAMQKAELI